MDVPLMACNLLLSLATTRDNVIVSRQTMHLTANVLPLVLLKTVLCSSFAPRTGTASRIPTGQRSTSKDLFEYFDPLLGPHAYPDGIQPGSQPPDMTTENVAKPQFDAVDRSSANINPSTSRPADSFFDPTISPHQYPSGAPDLLAGDQGEPEKKIGFLLIDHGSRRPESNQRLFELARLYQQSVDSDNTIVAAAHMEIASPSIKDGIALLMEAGVDEIICHPYFFSPGSHVQDDIPNLVKEACEILNVAIPIVTSEPLGSNTDLMIQAIDGMVKRASETLERSKTK